MKILKQSQIKPIRDELFTVNDGCCMLCGEKIAKGSEVLDHDHETGRIRGVIHGNCNILLGKIENAVKFRAKMSNVQLENFLLRSRDYVFGDYSGRPMHPTHKTKIMAAFRKMKVEHQKAMIESKRGLVKNKRILSLMSSAKNQKDRDKVYSWMLGNL